MILIIAYSLILSFSGGFSHAHPDNEFYNTKTNKSYFLHALYSGINKFTKEPGQTIKRYAFRNQKNAPALYIVNGIFSALGIYFMFLLAELLLGSSFWALIASFFFASSFYWIVESHYATVDMPMTTLSIVALYYMLKLHRSHYELSFTKSLKLGLVIALASAAKYNAALLFIPCLVLFLNFQSIKVFKNSIKALLFSFLSFSIVLAIFIADKFPVLLQRIDKELGIQYGKVFFGYTYPGNGYWFHISKSFFYNYGMLLTICALIGLFLAYKKFEDKKEYIALVLYSFAIFSIFAFSVVKAHRFVLPVLPIFCIFSTVTLFYAHKFIITKFVLPKKLSDSILLVSVLALSFVNVENSIKLAIIKHQPSTNARMGALLEIIKSQGFTVHRKPMSFFLEYPRFVKANNYQPLMCNSLEIDLEQFAMPDDKHVLILDSRNDDRFVYDPFFNACPNPKKRIFSNFENFFVIQLSPFVLDKKSLVYIQEAAYSGRVPNLKHRYLQGNFYEIYLKDEALLLTLLERCDRGPYQCKSVKASEAFYVNNMNRLFLPEDVKKELGID